MAASGQSLVLFAEVARSIAVMALDLVRKASSLPMESAVASASFKPVGHAYRP